MKAKWTYATYDVWGNAEDGYDVNDVYRGNAEFEMDADNDAEVLQACKDHLGLKAELTLEDIELDGDDMTIYVNAASDSYLAGQFTKVAE